MIGPYAAEIAAKHIDSQPKKLNWLDRWFIRMSKRAWEAASDKSNMVYQTASSPAVPTRSFDANGGLNMTVYSADGGYVVQFNHYDNKIDRSYQNLHIIGHNEDFSDRISQIITLELIKNGKGQ
jgi:hypothetical protein